MILRALALFACTLAASCYGGRCFSSADCPGAICDLHVGCGAQGETCLDTQTTCEEGTLCLDGECGGQISCVEPCGGAACRSDQVCENDACAAPPCTDDDDCALFVGNTCNDGRCAQAGRCAAVASPPPP